MMRSSIPLHLYGSINATFLAPLESENTHRFSLGHVPIQPSMKDREVDLFIEPATWREMLLKCVLKKGKREKSLQFVVAILQ